jgi:flavin-dependent dehydrogenase
MSARQELTTDVCVLGGGPAGTTAARCLAQLGYDVCLLERETFPRPRVGESLPAGVLPLLDALGVRDRVERAGFLRPKSALVKWAAPTVERRVHPGPPGLQVDRGRFDLLLLDAAQEAGVRVIQPAIAARPTRRFDGRWSIDLRMAEVAAITAQFIVVATGRQGFLGGKRNRASAATLALYGYWQGTTIEGPETRVEAGCEEWVWCAPLADGTVAAAGFIDPKRVAVARSKNLTALYRSALSRSAVARGCLDGSLISDVSACDASCVHTLEPIGEHIIRIGDAGLAMDPLSSQGVQSAIASGLQSATVVNTVLARPSDAATAARFYQERLREKLVRHCATSARFYGEMAEISDHSFWHRRS